jgi:hypothetical protein
MTSGCPDAAGRVQLVDSNVVAVAWGERCAAANERELSASLDHHLEANRSSNYPLQKRVRDFTASVAVEAGEPVRVKVRIAKQFLAYANPLHEQADVEFVGHADAAVHLDRFLHGERGA